MLGNQAPEIVRCRDNPGALPRPGELAPAKLGMQAHIAPTIQPMSLKKKKRSVGLKSPQMIMSRVTIEPMKPISVHMQPLGSPVVPDV